MTSTMSSSDGKQNFTDRLSQQLAENLGDVDDFAQAKIETPQETPYTALASIDPQQRGKPVHAVQNPIQFSNVALDPKLRAQGAKDIGYLGHIALRYQRGQLTKEQVIKTTQLIFNTEFHHMALLSGLKLSEANEAAIHAYQYRTADMRKQMSVQIGKELTSVVDVYWKSVERAARARAEWQTMIKKLQTQGLFTPEEAAKRLALSTEMMNKIESECKAICDQIVTNLMDKVQHALSVRVNQLIGDDNASAAKLIPN